MMHKSSSRYPYVLPPWPKEKCDALVAALEELYKEFPIGTATHGEVYQARRVVLSYAEMGNTEAVKAQSKNRVGVPYDRILVVIALLE